MSWRWVALVTVLASGCIGRSSDGMTIGIEPGEVGMGACVSLDAATVTFEAGDTLREPVVIQVANDMDCEFESVALVQLAELDDPDQAFEVVGFEASELHPGEVLPVSVRFVHETPGSHEAQLAITVSNDFSGEPSVFRVQLFAQLPE